VRKPDKPFLNSLFGLKNYHRCNYFFGKKYRKKCEIKYRLSELHGGISYVGPKNVNDSIKKNGHLNGLLTIQGPVRAWHLGAWSRMLGL